MKKKISANESTKKKWIKSKIKKDGDTNWLYFRIKKRPVLKYFIAHWLNDYLPKPKKEWFLWKYAETRLKDCVMVDMETNEKTATLNGLIDVFPTLKKAENKIRELEKIT